MTFRVDVVSLGRMPLPGPEVFWMAGWDDWFDATFWMVVARDATHTVVVNTGPPEDLRQLNEMWGAFHPSGKMQFSRVASEAPSAALASLGVAPEDVTHVILSPIVVYTTGNLPLFANAEFILSRRGWIEDVFAPPYPTHLPRELFLPDDAMSYLLFDARQRIRLVEEGEILPGLSVWPSLVHHRSSLAINFDTPVGRVTATDSAFAYKNVEANIHLGIGESYAEAMATYERLRREADVLLPLYEPQILDRHPGGRIA